MLLIGNNWYIGIAFACRKDIKSMRIWKGITEDYKQRNQIGFIFCYLWKIRLVKDMVQNIVKHFENSIQYLKT
jgi:hypothetical protein